MSVPTVKIRRYHGRVIFITEKTIFVLKPGPGVYHYIDGILFDIMSF